MKWKYQPQPETASQGVACCDVVNRGATYDNGRIYFNTLDGQTAVVDAQSGALVTTKGRRASWRVTPDTGTVRWYYQRICMTFMTMTASTSRSCST